MIREDTKAQVIGVNWQRDSGGYAVEVYGAGRAYSRVGPRAIDDALAFLATLPIDSYATPSDTRRTSWVLPVFEVHIGSTKDELLGETSKAMKAGLFQGHVVLVSHASREAIGEIFDKKVGRR